MSSLHQRVYSVWVYVAVCTAAAHAGEMQKMADEPGSIVPLVTHSINGTVRVRSWRALRDQGIVKQQLDNSCGAASIATLLRRFYGIEIPEEAILRALDKQNGRASFEDMARLLAGYGFRAKGFATNWDGLLQLKIPVILYVKHKRSDHFTVLRGINEDTVWLADPSLGNRTYSREQFLSVWNTRDNPSDGLTGKFLAVLPSGSAIRPNPGFFTNSPRRQSSMASSLIINRTIP